MKLRTNNLRITSINSLNLNSFELVTHDCSKTAQIYENYIFIFSNKTTSVLLWKVFKEIILILQNIRFYVSYQR